MKTEDRYYSDKEVKAFLHNLAISVVRWDKFKDQPPSFFSAARNLAGGLVLEMRDVFSHDEDGNEMELMDEGLCMALIAAAHILLSTSTESTTDEEVEAETKSLAKKKLVRTK